MLTTTPSVCLSEPKLTSPTMKICSVLSLSINRTLTNLNLPLTESNFISGEVIFFMINNSYLRKCNECYERNQKFSLLLRFTKYCFLCTFLVIIIIMILMTIIIIIIIIRERWLDSCDPWLLVTHSKGIFPVDQQNWVSSVQETLNLIRLSYFLIDHFYPLIIKTLMT